MKFTEMDYEYLRGKDFSNGYKLKLQCNPLYARTELVKNLVSSVRGGGSARRMLRSSPAD